MKIYKRKSCFVDINKLKEKQALKQWILSPENPVNIICKMLQAEAAQKQFDTSIIIPLPQSDKTG